MKSFLYAVQDQNGREIVSAVVEVEKVGDVTASVKDNLVTLSTPGLDQVERVPKGAELTLHRWDADDKLAEPVSHPVES